MKLKEKSNNQLLYEFTNGDLMLVNTRLKLIEHYYKENKKDRIMTALGDFNRFKSIGD